MDGFLPLWHAVRNGHLEAVETMLEFPTCLTGLQRAFQISPTHPIQATIAMAMERYKEDFKHSEPNVAH